MALLHVIQLYSGVVTSSTATVLYTVPAGERAVLHDVNLRNNASSASTVRLQIGSGVALNIWSLAAAPGAGCQADWYTWVVLEAGQDLRVSVSAATGTAVVLSGYHYTI